jgi:non-ribosomal peptide synthetase component E (peptide arylation enzyme)
MNLSDFLTDTSKRFPDHPAIRYEGSRITFAEMSGKVDALCRGFTRLGLKPGDVCVQMIPTVAIRIADGEKLPAGFTPLEELFDGTGDFLTYPTKGDDPFAVIYTTLRRTHHGEPAGGGGCRMSAPTLESAVRHFGRRILAGGGSASL